MGAPVSFKTLSFVTIPPEIKVRGLLHSSPAEAEVAVAALCGEPARFAPRTKTPDALKADDASACPSTTGAAKAVAKALPELAGKPLGRDRIIVVRGEGGHGSMPHRARDPIAALAAMAVALQTAVTRSFDALDPVVITIGRIAGGTKENIIPDTAELDATIRTLSHAQRERVQEVGSDVTGPGSLLSALPLP